MNDLQEKKYRSGSEVLEKYVPDYDPEVRRQDDEDASLNGCASDKLGNQILADLKEKIDKIQIATKTK